MFVLIDRMNEDVNVEDVNDLILVFDEIWVCYKIIIFVGWGI